MYDYDQNGTRRPISLLVTLLGRLLLILIFILILLLIFPTKKSLNPLYQGLFRDNLNSMKNAAETYYTNERLPIELDGTVKMTLGEMLDKNLLLPFVDKNNKQCDLDKSYVEITKKATEYEMKVKLVCSDEESFIIEHLGCTDKCNSGTCGNVEEKPKEEVKKQIEYQFKKNIVQNKLVEYTCPDGYKLKGKDCYKTINTEKIIDATPQYENEVITSDAICETNKKYECPTGWSLSGTNCVKAATATSTSNTTYSCSTGTLSGTNCVKAATATSTSNTTYSCSIGTLSGTSCYIGNASTGYNYSTRTSTSAILYSGETIINSYTKKSCDTCSTIRYYTIRKTTTYKYCSTGTLSGNGCYKTATPNTTTKKIYSCSTGWSLSGTNCIKAATATSTSNVKYSCPTGTLNDTTCTIEATEKATQTCMCPTGYIKENGVCSKIVKKLFGYICPAGFDKKSNTSCSKIIQTIVSKEGTPKYEKVTTTVYRWASTSALSGWVATGKTREK